MSSSTTPAADAATSPKPASLSLKLGDKGIDKPQVPAAPKHHNTFASSTLESLEKKKGDKDKPSPTSSTGSGASLSTISTHTEVGTQIGSYISASGDDEDGRNRTMSQILRAPTASPTPPGDGLPKVEDSLKN
jgi:hypothetical protein